MKIPQHIVFVKWNLDLYNRTRSCHPKVLGLLCCARAIFSIKRMKRPSGRTCKVQFMRKLLQHFREAIYKNIIFSFSVISTMQKERPIIMRVQPHAEKDYWRCIKQYGSPIHNGEFYVLLESMETLENEIKGSTHLFLVLFSHILSLLRPL